MQGELTGLRPFDALSRRTLRCVHTVTKPSHVRLETISVVMSELAIDISHHRSKSVAEFTGHADLGSRFLPAMDGELSGWMGDLFRQWGVTIFCAGQAQNGNSVKVFSVC